ncbi:hypothetical protein B0J13DRAFT_229351 [Dactylonectria estremocensis]|uniref:Zn(2)-C6 fungal-type domain-containing protein n=1 Tax=Dactylonectria estremocensis TaxID=1079267 RepID=A0A9P9JCI3_9HYPO|nr:hypothetical protein B0J13DRAFT_229351 [Dactylonectria estremocensis]
MDIKPRVNATSQPNTPQSSQAGSDRPRATTTRISLACVHCRNRHSKCDGKRTGCERCRRERRLCGYLPSLRGIKNPNPKPEPKSKPKEAASVTNATDAEPPKKDAKAICYNTPAPDLAMLEKTIMHTKPFPGGWVVVSPTHSTNYLFDFYYSYFHDSHSWLPPKRIMAQMIDHRVEGLGFIATMITYIGSIYTKTVDTGPLRTSAFDMASSSLPKTIWNVQALLCVCIAALGDGYIDLCGPWFDKAVEMALKLGLQNKSFADAEPNLVLAESYRRTYWGLCLHGSLRTVREHLGHFQLYDIVPTTDLPCEEWEYQGEEIPKPVSFGEIHHLRTSRDYSSWAYLAELVKISGESVVPLLNVGIHADAEAVDRADDRIVAWILQLPKWKMDLVDPDGASDMILYLALGIAHGLRIRIQLNLIGAGGGVQFRIPETVRCGPIFRHHPSAAASLTGKTSRAWMYGSKALQASLAVVNLFNANLPPEKFSPTCTLGIEKAVIPLLDAYLFGSVKPLVMREKIMLLANVLATAGEFWPNARAVSVEIIKALGREEDSLDRWGDTTGLERIIDNIMPTTDERDALSIVPLLTTEEMNALTDDMLAQGEPMALYKPEPQPQPDLEPLWPKPSWPEPGPRQLPHRPLKIEESVN